ILLGFINKPYEQKVLMPRALKPSERRALTALQGLSPALGVGQELTPADRDALKKIKLTVGEGDTAISAAEAADLFHALQDVSRALGTDRPLTPADREALQKIKLTLADNKTTVEAEQAVTLLRQLQGLVRTPDSGGAEPPAALQNVRLTLAD